MHRTTITMSLFILSIILTSASARAADLFATLTAAAGDNKASLRAFATRGCADWKADKPGLRVLEVKFLGGQTARLLVVDVVRHGEQVDVSFFTPGTSVLTTRSLKLRPGTDPLWIAADGKRFPVSDELKPAAIEASDYASVRAGSETAPCYVARLAQDFVRPRDFADAAADGGASSNAGH